MNERTFKAANAGRLEDPERLKWMPPGEAIEAIGLAKGMTVADIGAGTGYFAVPFARAVGPEGRVLAVDLQPEMLALIGAKLEASDAPGNIELLEGTAERTGLPDGACDVALLANLWHELDDHGVVLEEVRRVLKPGGRVAVLDWRADVAPPPGPPQDHRIGEAEALRELEAGGFRVVRSGQFGAYSYLAVAVWTGRALPVETR
jgi:ubiquinone/menaquinone biosynthesis C-methylase UbiE